MRPCFSLWVSFRAPLEGLRSLQKVWAEPSCGDRVPPKRPIGPGGMLDASVMDRGAERCDVRPSRLSRRASEQATIGTPWNRRKRKPEAAAVPQHSGAACPTSRCSLTELRGLKGPI